MATSLDFRTINKWYFDLYVTPFTGVTYEQWSESRVSARPDLYAESLLGDYWGVGSKTSTKRVAGKRQTK